MRAMLFNLLVFIILACSYMVLMERTFTGPLAVSGSQRTLTQEMPGKLEMEPQRAQAGPVPNFVPSEKEIESLTSPSASNEAPITDPFEAPKNQPQD
jgi:hypothetical protein